MYEGYGPGGGGLVLGGGLVPEWESNLPLPPPESQKRVVHILLECFLVTRNFTQVAVKRYFQRRNLSSLLRCIEFAVYWSVLKKFNV